MEKQTFVLKGNIYYSKSATELAVFEQAYAVCLNGISQGVFRTLPKEYEALPLMDMGDSLILPGLTDLHLHAPQYTFRALGMDLELLKWLNTNTFPEEAKYAELDYAREAYALFAGEMRRGATTRACVFGTIHTEATELLMDLLEETGICTWVGKVNMDRNSPDYLCEKSAGQSAADTRDWIERTLPKCRCTKPMITPRFVPSCSDELMKMLGELARRYNLPVQSHLSENPEEVAWVKKLAPESAFYGDAYDRFGLFGKEVPTIMAHCVYSGEEETQRIFENGVFIAHCPQSNTNIASGIAPVRRYLDRGMRIGLGTDVAGGFSASILRAMADSIQVSKLRWRLSDETLKPVSLEEAFYMGTKGGGAFFGKAGSFEEGYLFDAVALDDSTLKTPRPLSLRDRLERAVYMSEECRVVSKYVEGRQIRLSDIHF